MNLNANDLFFPVLNQRLMNLAKEFEMDRLEVCASWRGEEGFYSETRDVILGQDAIPMTLKQFEDSIIASTEYNSIIKKSMLSQIDRLIDDSSINILIDVRLPGSESGPEPDQRWF